MHVNHSWPDLPIWLPGVHDLGVHDVVQQGLVVEEVEHVLDGEGQGRAAVGRAEDTLEQVVDELLQRALQ